MNEEFRSENGDYGRKSSKLPKIIIILIFIIMLGTIVFLLNDKYEWIKLGKKTKDNKTEEKTEKKESKEEAFEKIDETKGLYYIEEGKSYKVYPKDKSFDDFNKEISFSYPVINSKTESATKVNLEIKKMYEDLKKMPYDKEEYAEDKKEGIGCTCVKIDDKKYCASHIFGYSYEIEETESVINIMLYEDSHTNCASGWSVFIKSYFISKKTGEVLTNEEVLSLFGYKSGKIVKAYNNYIVDFNKKHNEDIEKIKSVDELLLGLNKKVLYVYGPVYTNSPGDYLDFDGTKFSDPYEKLNDDEDTDLELDEE